MAEALPDVALPGVAHETTAAVLVVDLDRQVVTYVNELAQQLAPEIALPAPVDDWSRAAGLEDVVGDELPTAGGSGRPGPAEPLLRIAQGEPVTGEAVTAERGTAATGPREPLWVVGLPLADAPEPISTLALVAFLPARNARQIAGAQESAVGLRDRAMLATRVSFTITDPSLPDDPLVWVNPAFTATTGYEFADVVGRNCRFLQGPDTDPEAVAAISSALREQRAVTVTLRNYRKDGTPFWNELSISPVRDERGVVTHFVGVQDDVTDRVETQRTRDAALTQVAGVADRLGLLADMTSRMAVGQRPEQIVELLAQVLVPRLATACAVYTFDDAAQLTRPYLRHQDEASSPTIAADLAALSDSLPGDLPAEAPVWQILRGASRGVVVPDLAELDGDANDARAAQMRVLGLRSLLTVPLLARRSLLGAVVLFNDAGRPAFEPADLDLVQDLAVRAGLMLENTQLYAREQATAAILQRSLLPRLPEIPGLEIAASYVPAADEAAVGGDWYDVFQLRDHAGVGVVVGDVMGHNFDSAARMGKLSTIVRAYGWPGSEPNTVLTALDELLEGSDMSIMATCFYGTLVLHGNAATLHYTSAGHPPALLRRPGGTAIALEDGRGPMIGISGLVPGGSHRPHDARIDLVPGSTLICFTDGLTDGFADEPDLDAGLAELLALTAALPEDASPAQIVDRLTSAAIRNNDDVAVVAIRIL